MNTQTLHFERTTPAGPEAVWRLLSDSSTWPDWTPIERHTQLHPPGPDGTGEIRLFTTGRVKVREEIVLFQPCQRLSYALRGGLALRDYRADIDLHPTDGGGTRITWHTTFKPKVPGTGSIYRRALEKATGQFIDGLAAAAAAADRTPHPESA